MSTKIWIAIVLGILLCIIFYWRRKEYVLLASPDDEIPQKDIQKYVLPEEKHMPYFNPSIVWDNDQKKYFGYIRGCAFAIAEMPWPNTLYQIEINTNKQPTYIYKVNLPHEMYNACKYGSGIQDARIFKHGNDYGAIANVPVNNDCHTQMCVWNFASPSQTFRLLKTPKEVAQKSGVEKNWSVFSYQGSLLSEYSFNPRIILDISTNEPTIITQSHNPKLPENTYRFSACPILFVDHNGNTMYLNMLHTRNKGWYEHYFYSFDTTFPFHVRNLSKAFKFTKVPIDYVMSISWKKDTDELVISYGVADKGAYIRHMPRSQVLSMLLQH